MAPPEIGSPPADKLIVPADSNPADEITGELKHRSLRKRGRPTKIPAAEGATRSSLRRQKEVEERLRREEEERIQKDAEKRKKVRRGIEIPATFDPQFQNPTEKIRVPSDSSSRAGGGEETSEEMSNIPEGRDWSALPVEILQLILALLCLKDYVRFGAVCVSWKHVFAEKLVYPAPQLPWLMYPHSRTSSWFGFYQLHNGNGKEECWIELPRHIQLPCPRAILGSTSDGFMIIYNRMSELVVMNPLTGFGFPFPSAVTLPLSGWRLISKAALLRRPNTPAVLAVAYKYGQGTQVAFSRSWRQEWTVVGECDGIAADMKFYKGLLYVITRTHGTVTWDLLGEHPPLRSMLTQTDTESYDRRRRRRCKFLVESTGGDLLQVRTILKGEYEVFKLDAATPKWCRLTSLCGDDAVLLSATHCVCVSTRDFPVLRRNCIYSTLEFDIFASPAKEKIRDWSPLHVYCLSDGTFDYYPLPVERSPTAPPPNWFTPGLV